MSWSVKVAQIADLPEKVVHGMSVREFVGTANARGVSVHAISMPANASFPANYHEDSEEIVFVLGGSARTRIGGVDYDISAGHTLYIPPGTVHSIVAGAQGFSALTFQSPPLGEGGHIYVDDPKAAPGT